MSSLLSIHTRKLFDHACGRADDLSSGNIADSNIKDRFELSELKD